PATPGKVGEAEYSFATVRVDSAYLWPKRPSELGYYYYPSWGWGPYWGWGPWWGWGGGAVFVGRRIGGRWAYNGRSPGPTAAASPGAPSSSVCPSSPTASAHSPSPSASADAKSKKGIDTRVFRDIAKTDVSPRTDMSVGYRGPKLSLRGKPVWHGPI